VSLMAKIQDDQGQAATEYILLLAIAVAMAVLVINKLIRPGLQGLANRLKHTIEARFFPPDGSAFHQLRIRR
jgi:Flp pilus assembly pilin Flp